MAFKNSYYKFLFLILLFISQNLFAQNPNPKGITIISHGFQGLGDFGSYWTDFAKSIKQRAQEATIYTNDPNTGHWIRLEGGGNPNDEIIFVLNWAKLSNIPFNNNEILSSDGRLESAADGLFAMLANPPSEIGFSKEGGIWNSDKPIHLIGHSRGVILNLQICHRLLKYYPSRQVEQFTSLDPHPANGLGLLNDINLIDNDLSLPGVNGNFLYGDKSIQLPINVVKADNYFRRNGIYEVGFSPNENINVLTLPQLFRPPFAYLWLFNNINLSYDFNGVPNISISTFNRELSNEILNDDASHESIAHSNVHHWYKGTIDTNYVNPASYYNIIDNINQVALAPKFNEIRSKTGYYYSRLGGGISKLPYIFNRTTIEDMDNRIASRSGGKLSGLQKIFNGHFDYGNAGWTSFMGNSLNSYEFNYINYNYSLKLGRLSSTVIHNWLYFPPTSDYITFKSKSNDIASILGFKFIDGDKNTIFSTQLLINNLDEFKDYFVKVPEALKGKTGTFSLELMNYFDDFKRIDIDDIDLTNNAPTPTASITALGETTFCNASQTVQLKASTTNPDYEYQWQKNGLNIASATDTIYTTNSAGDYKLKVVSKSTGLSAISDSIKISYNELTDFTVSGGGTVGIGEAIALNATGGEYYLWQGPNGFVSNVQYPVRYSATSNMSGNYTVKITAKSGCSATANVSVNVVSVSENSTNCPPLVRSLKSIDNNLGSAYHTQPFSDDKYITVLYKDNIYSLALLDSNLAVVWRKTLSSNVTELVTDNTSNIFIRIGNTISKYNSSGNLIWSTVPSIKIVQTLRTTISYPYSSSSTIGDIIINPNIVSMAQSNDGGVSFLFGSNTYKNKTEQSQYYSSQYQRTITVTNEYSYSPVNNSATETEDFFVAKIGSNGTVSWFKSYGDNCNSENPIKIKSTSNGGFVFMGKSCNNLLKTYRIDANGNTNWNSQLTLSNNSDVPITLSEASDGGALVGVSIFRNNQYDIWLGKINSSGGLQWNKTIGDESGGKNDFVSDIKLINNVLYFSGNLSSNYKLPEYGNGSNFLASISNSGTFNWQKRSNIDVFNIVFQDGVLKSIGNNSIIKFYNFNSANFQLNSRENLCQNQGINLEVSNEYWSNNDSYIKSIWYKDGKKIDDVSTNARSFYQDGIYHAKIEMTNGCSVVTPPVTIITPKISSNAIYVYNTDVSGYQSTSNGLCEGATLNLTTDGGDSYAWTGPNGFVSNLQNPSIPNITTANGGTYYVTITNNKRNCNVTLSTEVKVLAHPIAPLRTYSPVEEGENLSLDYHTNYNIIESQFSGPNGLNLIFPPNSGKYGFNITNASVANSGTYTIKLRQGNCIGTYNQNLVVNPCPLNPTISYFFYNNSSDGYSSGTLNSTNSFCIKPNTVITLRTQANITNSDVYGYKFQWYRFGVPIVNGTDPALTINQSGSYSVKVSRYGRCEKISPNFIINVNFEPEFTTNIPTAKPICQGQPFTFQASPQTNSYTWSGPDNFNATGHTIAVTNIQSSRSGNYTVKATNSAGCSTTKQFNFQVESIWNPTPYVYNKYGYTETREFNEGDSIALSSGYIPGDKYLWQGPNNFSILKVGYNSISINPLTIQHSGTFTLNRESANGCLGSGSVSILVKRTKIISDKITICKGEYVSLQAQNCTGKVIWSNGETTEWINLNVNPAQTTTYTARCKIGNFVGSASDPITLTVNLDPPKPVIRADNYSICYPDIVTLRSSGCSYQTSWYPYNTTVTDSVLNVNLPIGTHKLAFKCISANGCSTGLASDTITVNVYNTPSTPFINPLSQSSYPAGENVTLNTFNFGLPSDSLTLIWSDGQSGKSINVNPVVTTTYSVYAKNTKNCQSDLSSPVTVTINGALPLTIQANAVEVCAGSSINLSAIGCTGTVLWSTGQTGLSISTIINTVTTYTASCVVSGTTISNSNGLKVIVVSKLPTPQIQTTKAAIITGEGVTLTAQGCANTVKWSNGNTGNNIIVTPNSTTRYRAICTYGATCKSDSSNIQIVTVFANGTFGISADKDSVCKTNFLEYVIFNSVGCNYDVYWSTGHVGSSILYPISEQKTINATCRNGGNVVGVSNSVTIKLKNQWLKPSINTNKTISCYPASITLTASGCPNEVEWSGYSIDKTNSITLNSLPVGKHKIIAKCIIDGVCLSKGDTLSVTILQDCNFSVSSSKNVICQGDSVVINATGCNNGSVLWADGSTTISINRKPTITTKYLATCTVSGTVLSKDSVTITVNSQPVKPILSTLNNQICYPNPVTIKTSGCTNNFVDWSPYSTTHTDSLFTLPLNAGTYKLTSRCRTIGGCLNKQADTLQVVIRQTPNRPYIITPPNTNITSGQSITLNATVFPDSTEVLWSSGQTTKSIAISPTSTTIYKVLAKTPYCQSAYSDSVVVSVNGYSTLSISSITTSVCAGQSITLTSSGCSGLVVWSDGQTGASISKLINNTQTISAICKINTVPVSNSNILNIEVVSKQQAPIINKSKGIIIVGDSTQLNASGCQNTIYWSNSKTGQSIYVSPIITTNYKAVCGNGTCQSDSSNNVKITIFNAGTFGITASKDSVCTGESVTLNSIGCNYQVYWSNGQIGNSISLPISTNTSISATCKFGTNIVGASNTINVKIKYKWLKPTIMAEKDVICQNSYLKLFAKGCSYRYVWSNGVISQDSSITIYSPSTGVKTYSVICQNEEGCQSQNSDNKTIVIQASCSFKINASETTLCKGTTTVLSVAGCNGNVNWSNGNSTNVISVAPTITTKYLANCVEENGSTIKDSLIINVKSALPKPTLIATDTTICYPNNVVLSAIGCTGEYDWYPYAQSKLSSALSFPLAMGNYAFSVRCKSDGCVGESSDVVRVHVQETPQKASIMTGIYDVQEGQTFTLNAMCSPTDSVRWSNGMTGRTIQPTATLSKSYYAYCQNPNCTGIKSDPITITVNSIEPIEIASDKKSICTGQSVNLSAIGCLGQVNWSNGMTGTAINPIFNTSSLIYATCTENNKIVSESNLIDIQVSSSLPTPTIRYNVPAIKQGNSAILTAQDCLNTVKWSNGQTGNSIEVSPTISKNYRAICTNANCVGDSSNTVNIIVYPQNNFSISADKDSICNRETVNFTSSGCAGTIEWSNDLVGNTMSLTVEKNTKISAICRNGETIIGVSNQLIIKPRFSWLKPTLTSNTLVACNQSPVTLTATGCPQGVSWLPHSVVETGSVFNLNLQEGTHKIAVRCKSQYDCLSSPSDTIIIKVYKGAYAPMISGTIANEDLLPKGTIINLNASPNVLSPFGTINWYFKRPNGTYIDTIFNQNSITYTLNETTIVYASTKTRYCETKSNGSQYFVDSNINVGCYSMNGNAQDGSGRGRHGDIRGSVIATTDRFNNPNSALYFPGNLDSWMRVGTPLPVGPSFSINAWMYRENGSSFYLLGQGKKDILSGWFGLLCGDEFYEKPGFGVKYGAFTPDKSYAYSNESLENNKWYMLTGVLDNINNKIKFYVNGILKGESLYEHDNSLITFYGFPFAIGRHTASEYDFLNYGTGETYPFKGKIDDVCIFNEALTDAQILAMYGIIDCPENGQINGQNFYMLPNKLIKKASNTINSNSTIFSSSVEFNAGKAIILGHGFKVERGAVFKASIEGCGNTNTPIPQPASQFLYDKEAIDPKKKN
jgi:hypothetical protein